MYTKTCILTIPVYVQSQCAYSGYATLLKTPKLSCTASLYPKDYGPTVKRHSHVRWVSATNPEHQRYQPRCISFGKNGPAKLSSTYSLHLTCNLHMYMHDQDQLHHLRDTLFMHKPQALAAANNGHRITSGPQNKHEGRARDAITTWQARC